MNRVLLALFGSVFLLLGLFFFLGRNADGPLPLSEPGSRQRALVVYCAAANRPVMEAIAADYQKEYARNVQLQFGASQALLAAMEVNQTGDLFIPADASYLELGRDKGLVEEVLPIAGMRPVVVTAKGNPKQLRGVSDLWRADVRVVHPSPEATAIGKLARELMQPAGAWDSLVKHSQSERLTVTDVANDVAMGAADAGIVYDVVARSYPELEAGVVDAWKEASSPVSIGVLTSASSPASALHFARYVAARDRGQKRFQELGFEVADEDTGDVWEAVPKLAVFAGSMLKPAIEETITAFEAREGVEVSRVYNGCGILVAQMKAGQHPDAYFACDSEFMSQVPDIFPEPQDVSQNELVILVQKGNPKGLASLKDLGKPGLRVGIGHEKQCAMGWLTQNTFREAGIQQEVMENVVVQTPSGDMLVNQMQTGSLDASVAYLSNAAGASEFLDAIRIEGLPCSVATQPFAIAVDSPRRHIAGRLFARICSAESQEIFQAEGFRWQFRQTTVSRNEGR